MTNKDIYTNLGKLDPELIAKAAPTSKIQNRKRYTWNKWSLCAACLLLIICIAAIGLILYNLEKNTLSNPPKNSTSTTITKGAKISGTQGLILGSAESNEEGSADMIGPGFVIRTVIEAEVIEVLSDTYYYASTYYIPFHVARLRVVDQIRGDGLPQEIFLCYPYYDTTIFEGYESFILSLTQVGVENYMLVNDTQNRVDYFSNMFEVCGSSDLGYGSVIAFNNGKVDGSFWKKTNHLVGKFYNDQNINDLLTTQSFDDYPASHNSKISKVKENIIKLTKDNGWRVYAHPNYITADDIFVSKEAAKIRSYVEPSETNVFMYYLNLYTDRIGATYTRVINGFKTNEVIYVNSSTGVVTRSGDTYGQEDLMHIPNIGKALENMDLSQLEPPHKILSGMSLKNIISSGVYRKIDGNIYGIVRVVWNYAAPQYTNSYLQDDLYYLCDEDGNSSIISKEELKEIIGDDSFVINFAYSEFLEALGQDSNLYLHISW